MSIVRIGFDSQGYCPAGVAGGLEESDTGFGPELEWHNLRPQLLFAIGIVTVDMLENYLAWFFDLLATRPPAANFGVWLEKETS